MKTILHDSALFLLLWQLASSGLIAQTYEGPARGRSLSPGNPVSPSSVSSSRFIESLEKRGPLSYPPFTYSRSSRIQIKESMGSVIQDVDQETSILSFQPLTQFEGIQATGWAQPDPTIAVGVADVLLGVNSVMAICNKDSVLKFKTQLKDWFRNVLPNSESMLGPYQPRFFYDHHDSRWLMLALVCDTTSYDSYILLSASDSINPMASWKNWLLDARLNGMQPTSLVAHDLSVGFDDNTVYVSVNHFSVSDGFKYAKIRILDKSEIYSGSVLNWWDFWDLRNSDQSTAFAVQPAVVYGTPDDAYFVNSRPDTGSSVSLWTLTLTNVFQGSPTLSRDEVTLRLSYEAPPAAIQKGDGDSLDTGDARLSNVIYREGYVWCGMTESGKFGGNQTLSFIRSLQIDVTRKVVQYDQSLGDDGLYYL